MANENWLDIKNEYINSDTSYRKLAEKYGVSFAALRGRAEKENWVSQKKYQQHKISMETAQKTADVIIAQNVDRTLKQLEMSDQINRLLDKWIMTISESELLSVDAIDKAAAALKKIQDVQRIAEGKDSQNDVNIVINHTVPRSQDGD